MKYRIVHVESKDALGKIIKDYYNIQHRILFMWFDSNTLCGRIFSCGAGFYGKFERYYSVLCFHTLEKCEKHLNDYFLNNNYIKYKDRVIKKMKFTEHKWKDYYVICSNPTGLNVNYFYDEDLEKVKNHIDKSIITTKTTVIN